MKTCTRCGVSKELECFAWRNRSKGTRHAYCKECRRAADNAKWATGSLKETNYESKQRLRERNRDYVWNVLTGSECMDCGEDNPVVLDFDHVRGKKIMSIAIMIQKRATLKKIQDEIDKCEIVCSNCHRIRTSKRGDHWRTARFDNELAALV